MKKFSQKIRGVVSRGGQNSASMVGQARPTGSSSKAKWLTSVALLGGSLSFYTTRRSVMAYGHSFKKEYSDNKYDNSIKEVDHFQYPANYPSEDRFSYHRIDGVKNGVLLAVFDGHCGWQAADFAGRNLNDVFTKNFASDFDSTIPDSIKLVLSKTFDDLENQLLDMIKSSLELGIADVARVGSCALVATLVDKRVTVGNAGDCQAVLCKREGSNLAAIDLSKVFNANNPEEQQRMLKEFPDEDDIYACFGPGACYVKNRLMPTRSLGDFYLKMAEFNNPKMYPKAMGYITPLEKFTGPYLDYRPDFMQHDVVKGDEYLILATDGLWDEMTPQQAADIVNTCKGDLDWACEKLRTTALQHAADTAGITYNQILNVPQKKTENLNRRNLHDDITVVILDLKRVAAS